MDTNDQLEPRQKFLLYEHLAYQFLSLVEICSNEIVKEGNICYECCVPGESKLEEKRWSDLYIIAPLLFDLYHGVELLLKALVSLGKGDTKATHGLTSLYENFKKIYSDLNNKFIEIHPDTSMDHVKYFLAKYVDKDQLPSLIKDFLEKNDLLIDNLYAAFRYPTDTKFAKSHEYFVLRYQGQKGLPFFRDLASDIQSVRPIMGCLGEMIEYM